MTMGRPGIDKNLILAAIQVLVERGEQPNTVNVRREVGGGSYGTIGDVLEHWKEEQKAPAKVPSNAPPLPEKGTKMLADVEAGVLNFVRPLAINFWHLAAKEAEAKLDPVRIAIAEEREAMDEAKKEVRSVIAELENRVADLEASVQEAKVSRNAAVAQLLAAGEAKGRLGALLETAKAENATLQQRNAQLVKEKEEIAQCTKEMKE
jgi:hypothetical protein